MRVSSKINGIYDQLNEISGIFIGYVTNNMVFGFVQPWGMPQNRRENDDQLSTIKFGATIPYFQPSPAGSLVGTCETPKPTSPKRTCIRSGNNLDLHQTAFASNWISQSKSISRRK